MTWVAGGFTLSLTADTSQYKAASATYGGEIDVLAFSTAFNQLEDGINAVLTKDGNNSPSANLGMDSNKHTNTAKSSALNEYQRGAEAVTQWPIYLLDQNAVSSASISCQPSGVIWPAANAAGQRVQVKMARTYPSAPAGNLWLRVASATSDSVIGPDGTNLMPGALVEGHIHEFMHDGSNWRCMDPQPPTAVFFITPTYKGINGAPISAQFGTDVATFMAHTDGQRVSFNMKGDTNGVQGDAYVVQNLSASVFIVDFSNFPEYLRPTGTRVGPNHLMFKESAAGMGTHRYEALMLADGRFRLRTRVSALSNSVQGFFRGGISMSYLISTGT